MKIILYQPQIPQNTGNIVRTCAVTGCDLILVKPLGFQITDRWLKRSGLDYWEHVNVEVIDNLEKLLENYSGRFHLFTSKSKICYTKKTYQKDDLLIFGSETAGLPSFLLERYADCCATLPMRSQVRCLNLATAVGIAVYEGWRQQGFENATNA